MTIDLAMRLLGAAICCAAAATTAAENEDLLAEVTVEAPRYVSSVNVGGKTQLTVREIPYSVSVVTEQRIEDQNLTTVAEALGTVTGVTIVPNSGQQSQYRSRGYALNAMFDGVPASQSLSGYLQFDLAAYERLEVLRGPNGLLQGSGDPAGTVNLVSKRGHEEFAVAVAATAGSWNKFRVSADITGALNDRQTVLARAVTVFEERDDFVDTSHYERMMGYGALDWHLSPTTLARLNVAIQSDRAAATYTGLPSWADGRLLDVPRSTNLERPWSRNDWDTASASVEVQHDLTREWHVTLRAWQHEQDFYFRNALPDDGVDALDFTLPFGRREYDYDYSRRGIDVFVSGAFSLFERTHSLFFGYNQDVFDTSFQGVERRRSADLIRVSFDQPELIEPLALPYDDGGETRREQSGFYTQLRARLTNALTIVVGARLTDIESSSRDVPPAAPTQWLPGPQASDQLSSSAGIVYSMASGVSLYASYADIFVPQSTALRANGESLEPRTGEQFEIGAKAELFEGRLSASIAAYRLRDTHRSMSDPINPGFVIDAGQVESKGWETEIVGSPAHGYDIQLGYSRLDSQYAVAQPSLQGERFSALEPRHSWKLWAIRRIDAGTLAGMQFGVGVTAQSGIESTPPRSQGGYAVTTAMLGYRLASRVTLTLNVNNVFDKVYYRRLGGTNSYNAFGPPRNYQLSVTAKF